jgi:hypothetical protein
VDEKMVWRKAYKVIWEPLPEANFMINTESFDGVVVGTIHTRGNPTKLGYFDGGFRIIADELAKELWEDITNTEVLPEELKEFDKVLYTGASKEIDYLGAVCVVFSSKQV